MPPRTPRTMLDKVWDAHVIVNGGAAEDLIYVDLHLLHEMTSPQAFEALRRAGRAVRRPDQTLGTEDHNVPTLGAAVTDPLSRVQIDLMRRNCSEFGVPHHPMGSESNGIVHVIGPEMGLSQPGLTIVCGDSHTSTHGALGALAFGIGTSQVEHVLATQALWLHRPTSMRVEISGTRRGWVSAKDVALHVVHAIGNNGAAGAVIEFCGSVVEGMTIEERMTLCNMAIETGARAGMVAPDQATFDYLEGRRHAPNGPTWDDAVSAWQLLGTDDGATFDSTTHIDGAEIGIYVTWGTSPEHVVSIDATVPSPDELAPRSRDHARRALAYMGLDAGAVIREIPIDTVFIGSCTNGRIEDLRAAAKVVEGRHIAMGVSALVVPGSQAVAAQARDEGLVEVFREAGFEWRTPGCSMCTAMNPDMLKSSQRSASTTNRNFEGRQGPGARTHLVSPAVAAATAVLGHLGAPWDLS